MIMIIYNVKIIFVQVYDVSINVYVLLHRMKHYVFLVSCNYSLYFTFNLSNII